MTIFIDENIPLVAESLASGLPATMSLHRFHGRTLRHEDLSECVALLIRSTTRINAELLEGTPVQFVGTATSGTEHVDSAYLLASGRVFCDARGCNANSVAEYVVFAMLHWAETTHQRLQGKTLGIIGYGFIGKRVAELAQMLGLRVLVSDPPFRESNGVLAPYCSERELDNLLREADIITNHVPLTKSGTNATFHLIGKKELDNVRSHALIIHASRGGIIAETALWEAAQQKKLSTVIDVWEAEPRLHTRLAKHSLIATAHTAGYSYEGKINGSEMIAQACCTFFQEQLRISFDADWSVFTNARRQPHLPNIDYNDHHALYRALQQSRDLEGDTARLLATLDYPDQEAGFDALRKNYPVRREILQRLNSRSNIANG
jgi:erythronate-4-phosphate dehydrogenase